MSFEVLCNSLRNAVAALDGVDRISITHTLHTRLDALLVANDNRVWVQPRASHFVGLPIVENEALPDNLIVLQHGRRVVGAINTDTGEGWRIGDRCFVDCDGIFRPRFDVEDLP